MEHAEFPPEEGTIKRKAALRRHKQAVLDLDRGGETIGEIMKRLSFPSKERVMEYIRHDSESGADGCGDGR